MARRRTRWLSRLLPPLLILVILLGGGAALITYAGASPETPIWELRRYKEIGYVHSFKADLIDELPGPPQLMLIGGSRTTRLEPDFVTQLTGLSAMNCAVSNCKPEDVWAFTNYLYSRAPNNKLRFVWGMQVGSLTDTTFAQGLIYDRRLSQWFPPTLIAEQKERRGEPGIKNLLAINRFTERGMLEYTRYDRDRERGLTLEQSLDKWIPTQVEKRTQVAARSTTRAKAYFEQVMALCNSQGVIPCIIIMPIQPRALAAFRQVPAWTEQYAQFKRDVKQQRTR